MPEVSDRYVIFRAERTIHLHGENALRYAADRADEFLLAGDLKGAEVWRRITQVVEQLLELRSSEVPSQSRLKQARESS